MILVCMAVDRYMCAMHPDKYHQHSSKKVRLLEFFYQLDYYAKCGILLSSAYNYDWLQKILSFDH